MNCHTIPKLLLILACLLLSFSCLGMSVGAAGEPTAGAVPTLDGLPDAEREEYRRLIDNAFELDRYSVTPSLFQICEDYRIDFDTVIVEYELNDFVLDGRVNEADGELIPSEYLYDHPIFYVPVYGVFGEEERIFGHISFRYVSHSERYVARAYTMTFDQQGELYVFGLGDRHHFLEKLLTAPGVDPMAAEAGIGTVEDAILLRYDMAGTDAAEKVLLLRTDRGIYVWDLSGSAHSGLDKELYGLSEYNTYREAYQDEENRSSLTGLVQLFTGAFVRVAAVIFGIMAVSTLLFTVMVVLIVKKLRAKKRGAQAK